MKEMKVSEVGERDDKQHRDRLSLSTADRDTSRMSSLMNERSKFLFLLVLFL